MHLHLIYDLAVIPVTAIVFTIWGRAWGRVVEQKAQAKTRRMLEAIENAASQGASKLADRV